MWSNSKKRVYLDWASAVPVAPSVLRSYKKTLVAYGNPGSPHEEGRRAQDLLEDARTRIARLAEVKPGGVTFAAGATEANALGIIGHVHALMAEETPAPDVHVLYLSSAHASVLGAITKLSEEGVHVEPLTLLDGVIDQKALAGALTPHTALVVVDAVCGETGTSYDTLATRRTLDAYQKGIVLFVDASQAPRTQSYTLAHVGADMLTLDAQKVGGVRGIGALLHRDSVALLPLIVGGGQERGLRPGTPTPALANAFALALEMCEKERTDFVARATSERAKLLATLTAIPNCVENGGPEKVPSIVNVSLIGRDTDYLAALLNARGYAVSTRSACETDAEGSHAVFAMTKDTARASSTLRISWGASTSSRSLVEFAVALSDCVRFLDDKAI